ncbi:MAG: UDP-2-acetamido-2,6-beta-L-arabino-hexul-4-ose reductase [Psychroserpens sp.]|jgi:UDP-2-acetamido-2,6-beta-L-arabino-hexul-4-ose reductase
MKENIIIGKGLIANTFKKYLNGDENLVIFASGVSNSAESITSEYNREKKLLFDTIEKYKEKKLIYFSTISVLDPSLQHKEYIKFKLQIEKELYCTENCKVVRASNIVGNGGNPNNMFNFFINSIVKGDKISLFEYAERNILSVDHLAKITLMILKKCETEKFYNILYPISFSPIFIYKQIEEFLNKKGDYEIIGTGKQYIPELWNDIFKLYSELNIPVTDNYVNLILNKYFINL